MALTGPTATRQLAQSHTQLAAVLQRIGNQPAAADSYRAAVKLYEQRNAAAPLNAQPKRDLSLALENLAELESQTGNPAAAPLYQRALQLRRELAVTDPQNLQARRDLAYAELRNSYGQVFASAGLDPLPTKLRSDSLTDIAQALSSNESRWQQGDITPGL